MQVSDTGRRETRLLLGTIAISAVMLALLALFRFPEETALQTGTTAAAPLERLVARATYDELATIMAELERRITPTVVVVPIVTDRGDTTYLPAARTSPDRAIALVGPGERVTSAPGLEAPIVIGRDVARGLAVLQVAARPGDVVFPRLGTPRPGPRYVALVEATPQGLAVRPVYVGRTDLFQDPRTGDSLLSVTAVQQTLPRGAALFTLDAAFMGFALESAGLVTVLPAQTMIAAADAAVPITGPAGDLDLDVQPLTPAIARSLGAATGVLVTHVDAAAAVNDRIRPLDVIQGIDDVPVNSVPAYQQALATREPGTAVTLTLWRGGKMFSEQVPVVALMGRPRDGDSGLVLHSLPGRGVEILEAEPGSPAARADLRPGDVVTAVGERRAPDAGDLQKAYAAARPGDALLLTVRRGTQHRVVALEKR